MPDNKRKIDDIQETIDINDNDDLADLPPLEEEDDQDYSNRDVVAFWSPEQTVATAMPSWDRMAGLQYLDANQILDLESLCFSIHQSVHFNSSLRDPNTTSLLPINIKDKLIEFIENIRECNMFINPLLKEAWEETKNCGRGKNMIEQYKARRAAFSKTLPGYNALRNALKKSPEVHHALYKAIHPNLAVDSPNLWLASRGGRTETGYHDALHTICASGTNNENNIYNELLPGTRNCIVEWTEGVVNARLEQQQRVTTFTLNDVRRLGGHSIGDETKEKIKRAKYDNSPVFRSYLR